MQRQCNSLKHVGFSVWKRREISEDPDRLLTTQTFSTSSAGADVHQRSDLGYVHRRSHLWSHIRCCCCSSPPSRPAGLGWSVHSQKPNGEIEGGRVSRGLRLEIHRRSVKIHGSVHQLRGCSQMQWNERQHKLHDQPSVQSLSGVIKFVFTFPTSDRGLTYT